jgi:hypothetical protein
MLTKGRVFLVRVFATPVQNNRKKGKYFHTNSCTFTYNYVLVF